MTLPAQQMMDQLNDLLDEYQPVPPNSLALTDEMKTHYLNMGQAAMWPRIYRVVQFEQTLLETENEYVFDPESVNGRLVYIDIKSSLVDACYVSLDDSQYSVLPGPVDYIRFAGNPAGDMIGGMVRTTFTMPLAPVVWSGTDLTGNFSGPDYAIEGPVLYAMNRITARGLHSRLDYGRQSVDFNNRSAVPNELMASSIFWLDEFERRVDMWQLVQPQSVA